MNITMIKEKMDDCLFKYITPLAVLTDILSKKISPDFIYECEIAELSSIVGEEISLSVRIHINQDGSVSYISVVRYESGIENIIPFEEMPINKILQYAPKVLTFAQEINDGKFIPKQKNL